MLMRPIKFVGGSVIVVFVCNTIEESQLAGVYTPLSGVQLLRAWKTPYQESGFKPGFDSQAFRVRQNAGKFMTSRAPDAAGVDVFGVTFTVCVFAIDQALGEVASVDRAEAGVKKIVPAIYNIFHTPSDLPTDMAPPGLLWLVDSGNIFGGHALTWKIRNGNHRFDDRTSPPNAIVQCYIPGGSYHGPGPETTAPKTVRKSLR